MAARRAAPIELHTALVVFRFLSIQRNGHSNPTAICIESAEPILKFPNNFTVVRHLELNQHLFPGSHRLTQRRPSCISVPPIATF
jgi:hypothetical protein